MTFSPLQEASEEFAQQLTRWRTQRGLSKRALASEMGFDPSYVSHIEGGRHRPTEDFARRAEVVLRTGGEIWQSYAAYDTLRRSIPAPAAPPEQEVWVPPGSGLIVEREYAGLSFRNGIFHTRVRRHLYNAGPEAVVRYPVRIRVDRYPGHPRRSARLHHGAPLTWSELGFAAYGPDGEPMAWQPTHDSDTTKELWLKFESGERRFPLYAGRRATIEYGYRVPELKWGPWFQRAIRLPTRELAIELDFPTAIEPAVWGTVSSLTSEGVPLGPAETSRRAGERTVFYWLVRSPALQARYRIEWRVPGAGA
ncbi:MAG TPA: helix-turn-helix transcriptional regulator [Micromonosporaceae bacterium]|nr:helix-turn-helix transcriptional regulator [Micromonosporaceae bacterium]